MWVWSWALTIVLAEAASIGQINVVTTWETVMLRSCLTSASLDATGTCMETLSLSVGCWSTEASKWPLRVERLCAGVCGTATKPTRSLVLIEGISIGKGRALPEILSPEFKKELNSFPRRRIKFLPAELALLSRALRLLLDFELRFNNKFLVIRGFLGYKKRYNLSEMKHPTGFTFFSVVPRQKNQNIKIRVLNQFVEFQVFFVCLLRCKFFKILETILLRKSNETSW